MSMLDAIEPLRDGPMTLKAYLDATLKLGVNDLEAALDAGLLSAFRVAGSTNPDPVVVLLPKGAEMLKD